MNPVVKFTGPTTSTLQFGTQKSFVCQLEVTVHPEGRVACNLNTGLHGFPSSSYNSFNISQHSKLQLLVSLPKSIKIEPPYFEIYEINSSNYPLQRNQKQKFRDPYIEATPLTTPPHLRK